MSWFSPRAWGWSAIDRTPRWRVDAFSPRAWGWSVSVHGHTDAAGRSPHARGDGPLSLAHVRLPGRVLPTRVGMVRDRPSTQPGAGVFSPRAWGWSVVGTRRAQREPRSPHARGDGPIIADLIAAGTDVLPTRVGMVRSCRAAVMPHVAFSPRAWGWSGQLSYSTDHARAFSPRAWGWSVHRSAIRRRPATFSPRAWGWSGHCRIALDTRREFSPRAWGWSVACDAIAPQQEFSPRAWGWSVYRRAHVEPMQRRQVLPTCVGMVRPCGRPNPDDRSPHVRGDGPGMQSARLHGLFSPRAWGWSGSLNRSCHWRSVLPTCVGMVRSSSWPTWAYRRSPHVRGDGPPSVSTCPYLRMFSPRAWGWSAFQSQGLGLATVLPT